MFLRSLTAALLVLVFAPQAGAADSVWEHEATGARAALARSVDAGYITESDQARYLGVIAEARSMSKHVPPVRALVLQHVLAQVARPKAPTAPRALELYITLAENADYLASHRLPEDGTDVTGADGAVYRYFANEGLEFHPLANAAALNALVAAGDTSGTEALVSALTARSI